MREVSLFITSGNFYLLCLETFKFLSTDYFEKQLIFIVHSCRTFAVIAPVQVPLYTLNFYLFSTPPPLHQTLLTDSLCRGSQNLIY